MTNTDSDVMITIRVSMIGKEIGSIIGKGGNVIASFREKSGAKISIPTAEGTPERIVTITGYRQQVVEAFKLITEKLEQDINANVSTSASTKVPVSMKLIVPASQCGSIIGRGGSKIKAIRDVQSDMLPFSTERSVMLNGSPCAIVLCVDMLCDVMIQFPAKFATVPYKPQTANPVIYHHGQAYTLQGNQAVPHSEISKLRHLAAMHSNTEGSIGGLLGNFTQLSGDNEKNFDGSSTCVNLPTKIVDADTQEITVSNEVIGRIIGKYGSRIKTIREVSGARITIEKSTERDVKRDRTITIIGSPEEISLAQYLINTSIQLFSHQSKPTQNPPADEEPSTSTSTPQPLMSLTPSPSSRSYLIDKLLSSTSPGSFGGLGLAGPYPGAVSMQPGASFNLAMESACLTFINRSRQYSNKHSNRPRQRSKVSPEEEPAATASDCDDERSPSPDNSSSNGKERRKPKREKFQPY